MGQQVEPNSPTTSPEDREGPSLLRQLDDLGDAIVSADLPSDPRKILGALIYYVETGSLEPPAPPPSVEETRQVSEADAEIARLRDQLAQANAANQAKAAAPAAAEGEAPAAPPAGGVLPGQGEQPPQPPAVSA